MTTGTPILNSIYRTGLETNAKYDERATKNVLRSIKRNDFLAISADNVAQFLEDRETFDVSRDCPQVVPPFATIWIEYQSSVFLHCDRVGILVETFELGDELPHEEALNALSIPSEHGVRGTNPREMFGTILGDPKWLVFMAVCVRHQNKAFGPVGDWMGVIDKNGSMSTCSKGGLVMIAIDHSISAEEESALAFGSLIFPALMTFSFMHCRNVVQVENLPTRQERRNLASRGLPVVKYKTLQIEPMRNVLVTEGGLAQNGLKKALHICRGHFSEYSEEKPLFGKYSGRFWIPAHVRGSAEAGKVVKDYSVKAPRSDAA